MSSLVAKVNQFNNEELILFLNKEGYTDVSNIIKDRNINGSQFLKLTEYDLLKWKLLPSMRRQLWQRVLTLKNDINDNVHQSRELKTPIKKISHESMNNFKNQLENVNKNRKITPPTPPPRKPPKPEYLRMDLNIPKKVNVPKTKKIDEDSELPVYDPNGYLQPSNKFVQEEESDYEPPPNEKLGKKPAPPPEIITEDYDYISDSEVPQTIKKSSSFSQNNMNKEPSTPNKLNIGMINSKMTSSDDSLSSNSSSSNFGSLTRKLRDLFKINSNVSMENKMQQAHITTKPNTIQQPQPTPVLKTRSDLLRNEYLHLRDRPLPPLPKNMSEELIEYENQPLIKSTHNKDIIEKEEMVDYENQSAIVNIKQKISVPEEVSPIYSNSDESEEMLKSPDVILRNLPQPPRIFDFQQSLDLIQPKNEEEELEDYDQCFFNLNDEPFYRYTDRKGAKALLRGLEDGAFLFRKSEHYFLTLTIKYEQSFFNLGIEKTADNKIRCHSEGTSTAPEFATLSDFVSHFCVEPLTFQRGNSIVQVFLKKALPENRF